jgi:hypothetical protein
VVLSIGEEGWPFPGSIVRLNGKWSFDAVAAKSEMKARQVGANELEAIETCAGYVEAQRKFASEDRDKNGALKYATRMMGERGRRDGFYWRGADEPTVPSGLTEAAWDGLKKGAKPYHGDFFRILDGRSPHAREERLPT